MKPLLARASTALLLALLAACGGGGGGGAELPPVVTPFLVITKVNGVPVPALGLKYQVTMESGDRIEVSASPEGAAWTVTADGNVIEAEASEDGGHWTATLNSPKGGQLVIEARSSADPSQEATITVLVSPQKYEAKAFVGGETRIWRETDTRNDGSVQVATLRHTTTQVAADGSHTTELRDDTRGTLIETRELDAADNQRARTFPDGSRCTYTPVRALLDYPLYHGKSTTTRWDYQCGAHHEHADAVSTVEDVQRITVPQGTHDALKLHTHVVFTQSNDGNLSGGTLGQATYAQDIVCWWSLSLRRTVSCTTTHHYTGTEPPSYAAAVVQELLEAR